MAKTAGVALFVGLLAVSVSMEVIELNETLHEQRKDQIWLVYFYAPWCHLCRELQPLWEEVEQELSDWAKEEPGENVMREEVTVIHVGKMDAIHFSSVASDFGVHSYPTIKLIKNNLAFSYHGPYVKERIVEFAQRVSGPTVRIFDGITTLGDAPGCGEPFFIYIGGESPLKEKFKDTATEKVVFSCFYMAPESVFAQSKSLPVLPAVIVVKDRSYYPYNELEDGALARWVENSRFPSFVSLDVFTLNQLAVSGKTLVLALLTRDDMAEQRSKRLLALVKEVAGNHKASYDRDVQFGSMDGADHINSLLMSRLVIPCLVLLNTTTMEYFVPEQDPTSPQGFLLLLSKFRAKTLQAYGGNGMYYFVKRIFYDAYMVMASVFQQSVLLGCFLYGTPVTVLVLICCGRLWMRPPSHRHQQAALDKEAVPKRAGDEADCVEASAGISEQGLKESCGDSEEEEDACVGETVGFEAEDASTYEEKKKEETVQTQVQNGLKCSDQHQTNEEVMRIASVQDKPVAEKKND
uniref:protein disulfide-isomerase TMX3-like isoform X2 n=1 Tax=Myxine glutinosa TaxID=7769 RepID=UPI00358E47FA